MSNKKGFSLLSFLAYLMLFSIITLFSCHIVVSLIIPSAGAMRKCQSTIALHIASDLFVRDIRLMKSGTYQWKSISPQELIWSQDTIDVGWCVSGNCLERREGVYDKGWKSSKTSIVAKNIARGVFTVEQKNNRDMGVELVLTPQKDEKKPVVCYIGLIGQDKNEKE